MSKLNLGDAVSSNDGLIGIVIDPGPYEDSPFQVMASDGNVYSFIEWDGRSAYHQREWKSQFNNLSAE